MIRGVFQQHQPTPEEQAAEAADQEKFDRGVSNSFAAIKKTKRSGGVLKTARHKNKTPLSAVCRSGVQPEALTKKNASLPSKQEFHRWNQQKQPPPFASN